MRPGDSLSEDTLLVDATIAPECLCAAADVIVVHCSFDSSPCSPGVARSRIKTTADTIFLEENSSVFFVEAANLYPLERGSMVIGDIDYPTVQPRDALEIKLLDLTAQDTFEPWADLMPYIAPFFLAADRGEGSGIHFFTVCGLAMAAKNMPDSLRAMLPARDLVLEALRNFRAIKPDSLLAQFQTGTEARIELAKCMATQSPPMLTSENLCLALNHLPVLHHLNVAGVESASLLRNVTTICRAVGISASVRIDLPSLQFTESSLTVFRGRMQREEMQTLDSDGRTLLLLTWTKDKAQLAEGTVSVERVVSESNSGEEKLECSGYSKTYMEPLREKLSDSDFISACEELSTMIDDFHPHDGISWIFGKREPIFLDALAGRIKNLKGVPVVAKIYLNLRDHGPTWVCKQVMELVLPPLKAGAPPWRLVPWDDCWTKIMLGDMRLPFEDFAARARACQHGPMATFDVVPPEERFKSQLRLGTVAPIMIGFVERIGYPSPEHAPNTCAKLLKEGMTFFSEGKELKKEIVAAKVAKAITGALEEHSAHEITCIRMGNPTRILPQHFVMPNSPSVASLLQDRSEVGECNEMARKLLLLKGQEGVAIHITTDDFTPKSGATKTNAFSSNSDGRSGDSANTIKDKTKTKTSDAEEEARKEAARAATKVKEKAAWDKATVGERASDIHFDTGDPATAKYMWYGDNAKVCVPVPEVRKLLPDGACIAVHCALMQRPFVFCPCKDKAGHTTKSGGAHAVGKQEFAKRSLRALLVTMAAAGVTGSRAPSASDTGLQLGSNASLGNVPVGANFGGGSNGFPLHTSEQFQMVGTWSLGQLCMVKEGEWCSPIESLCPETWSSPIESLLEEVPVTAASSTHTDLAFYCLQDSVHALPPGHLSVTGGGSVHADLEVIGAPWSGSLDAASMAGAACPESGEARQRWSAMSPLAEKGYSSYDPQERVTTPPIPVPRAELDARGYMGGSTPGALAFVGHPTFAAESFLAAPGIPLGTSTNFGRHRVYASYWMDPDDDVEDEPVSEDEGMDEALPDEATSEMDATGEEAEPDEMCLLCEETLDLHVETSPAGGGTTIGTAAFVGHPMAHPSLMHAHIPASAGKSPPPLPPRGLHLCSGPDNSPYGFKAQAAIYGFEVDEIDTLHGGNAHDISDYHVASELVQRMRNREYAFVVMGLPCKFTSVARVYDTHNGPPMLFSAEEPDGIAGREGKWLLQQRMAKAIYANGCWIARECVEAGGRYIAEHPSDRSDSKAVGGRLWDKNGVTAKHGSFWAMNVTKDLLASGPSAMATFAYCALPPDVPSAERRSQKYTTIAFPRELAPVLGDLSKRQCDHPRGFHRYLGGKTRDGEWRTSGVAPWPIALSSVMARALAFDYATQRGEQPPQVKMPAAPPPPLATLARGGDDVWHPFGVPILSMDARSDSAVVVVPMTLCGDEPRFLVPTHGSGALFGAERVHLSREADSVVGQRWSDAMLAPRMDAYTTWRMSYDDEGPCPVAVTSCCVSAPPPTGLEALTVRTPNELAAAKGGHHAWATLDALGGNARAICGSLLDAERQQFQPCIVPHLMDARTGALSVCPVAPRSIRVQSGATPRSWESVLEEVVECKRVACESIRVQLADPNVPGDVKEQLGLWLDAATESKLQEVPVGLQGSCYWADDSRLALIPFPAHARPVATDAYAPLPPPPDQSRVPPNTTEWEQVLEGRAFRGCKRYERQMLASMAYVMQRGTYVGAPSVSFFSFGPDMYKPWARPLIREGLVLERVDGKIRIQDQSRAPNTHWGREYLAEVLSTSPDRGLYSAVVTHGVSYLADLPPVTMLADHLRSFADGFASVHSELARLTSAGWYSAVALNATRGSLQWPCFPIRFVSQGSVARRLEPWRFRRVVDNNVPREVRYTIGNQTRVLSMAEACGMAESKRIRREHENASFWLRHTPAFRRRVKGLDAKHVKEPLVATSRTPSQMQQGPAGGLAYVGHPAFPVAAFEGLAPAKPVLSRPKGPTRMPAPRSGLTISKEAVKGVTTGDGLKGAAPPGTDKTQPAVAETQKPRYPGEYKPVFIELLLAICIMSQMCMLMCTQLAGFCDDESDCFHQFSTALAQFWACGIMALDPADVAAGNVDPGLMCFLEKCMSMGTPPSSNYAQRLNTELGCEYMRLCNAALMSRFEAMAASNTRLAQWAQARSELAKSTGRCEFFLVFLLFYTDDPIGLCPAPFIGIALSIWTQHMGPRGANFIMGKAIKRELGPLLHWVGGGVLLPGLLGFLPPEKQLRTMHELQLAIELKLTVADYTKLLGLLNHVVCLLALPYHMMYGLYAVLDTANKTDLSLSDIAPTQSAGGALQKWREAVASCPGTSALASAFESTRAPGGLSFVRMFSDAAKLGTAFPGICGHLYSRFWILPLVGMWKELPIGVTEFAGAIINVMIFGPELVGAPAALVLDAFVVTMVIASRSSGSPMLQWMHNELLNLAEFAALDMTLYVEHCYGPRNAISDAGSRGRTEELKDIMRHLGMQPEQVEVPLRAHDLLTRATLYWRSLSEEQRCATVQALEDDSQSLGDLRAPTSHERELGRSPACVDYDGARRAAKYTVSGVGYCCVLLAMMADQCSPQMVTTPLATAATMLDDGVWAVVISAERSLSPLERCLDVSPACNEHDGDGDWIVSPSKSAAAATAPNTTPTPNASAWAPSHGGRSRGEENKGANGLACGVGDGWIHGGATGKAAPPLLPAYPAAAPFPLRSNASTLPRTHITERLRECTSAYAMRPLALERFSGLLERMNSVMQSTFAPRTQKVDESHWRAWCRAMEVLGTPPVRDDIDANSGVDTVGHLNEMVVQAIGVLLMYAEMEPRSAKDPAADPRNATKKIEGVHRVHKTMGIKMAPSSMARQVVKGLCREYVQQHGVRRTGRKLPLNNKMLAGMASVADGYELKGPTGRVILRCERASYRWKAHFALHSTAAETGIRKEAAATPTRGPFVKGRLTFASLTYKIGGKQVASPTPAQLHSMDGQRGDGIWMAHGVAKNDFFGAFFADTPSFLPFDAHAPRNAARDLVEMELAAKVAAQARASTPLFGPEVGKEFTYHEVETAFELMLIGGAKLKKDEISNYSFHSYRIFMACALLDAKVPRETIKRLLRWRGDESLEIYARFNDEEWRNFVMRSYSANVDSTVAARLAGCGVPDLDAVALRVAGGGLD